MVFSGVFVAFAGGFILLWLYGQEWFLNFSVLGESMRDLFQVHTINLSVAVWVGFIALFGVATDDGVIMGTYLKQVFAREKPKSIAEIRKSCPSRRTTTGASGDDDRFHDHHCPDARADLYWKGSRYHDTNGHSHFRRDAHSGDDHVCSAGVV